MKRFRFSLQAALAHREHQQELAQRAMAEAQRLLVEREETLRQLTEESLEVEKSRPSSGSPEVILHSLAYLETLRVAIVRAKEQIQEAQDNVAQARTFLAERNRDVRALEILRDKQKEEFRKSQNATETKLLDDLAGIAKLRQEGVF